MGKRKKYSPHEKLEIVLTGLSSSNGIAEIWRRYGISTVQFYPAKRDTSSLSGGKWASRES